MRTCEYRNCRKTIYGRADKRYHSTRCRKAEDRARARDEEAALTWTRRLAELSEDDGSGERIYEEAEQAVLAKVKRKRSRGEYDAQGEWVDFRVREVGVVARGVYEGKHDEVKFDEQTEAVQKDARDVPPTP